MLSIRKVRLLITSRYIAMQSYECVIISKMFLIYLISYGCNGGALVFLGGAEASASPSFALPMFITIKKIIILHLFSAHPGTPVATPLFHWLIYYIYMQNICVVFRVKCIEWQVGCHTYYYYFGRVYRCNFNFNFRQCNMISWSLAAWYLKKTKIWI